VEALAKEVGEVPRRLGLFSFFTNQHDSNGREASFTPEIPLLQRLEPAHKETWTSTRPTMRDDFITNPAIYM
jgi:hypothetical protein